MPNKHLFISLLLLNLMLCITAFSNNDRKNRRYRIGVIPVLSFDSDLGLKVGGVYNFFDSQKKKYPNYDQYLNLKTTYTTRNTLNLQALFESTNLIREFTTVFEVTFTNDKKLDFFGFNGFDAVYLPAKNENFYLQDRRLLRLRGDFQKNLIGDHLRILAGFSFHHFGFKPIEYDTDDFSETSLYEKYIEWEIVSENEAKGGNVNTLQFGLIYDTRNTKCNTTEGLWLEGFVVYAPKMINNQAYSRLILTSRAYKTIINKHWIIAARFSLQNKLSGNIPYYMLPFYLDSQINEDGLGGAYSLRGITRNRIVAEGFVLANLETRFNLATINLFKTDFNIIGSLFFDAAMVSQRYPVNLSAVPDIWKSKLFTDQTQKPAFGFGPGLNIIYKHNNIITLNYGFSSNAQLGNGGFYVGSKFLF